MKKQIIFIILITIIITGCSLFNKGNGEFNVENKLDESAKEKFTSLISNTSFNIRYKLPENHTSNYEFTDMGVSIKLDIYTFEKETSKLTEYDHFADEIKKKDINGNTYEYYKFNNTPTHLIYIYRTKVNKLYYLFIYNVYNSEYDDTQVDKFMNTVDYK